MKEFQFYSGPDAMTAAVRHFAKPDGEGRSAYVSFTGKGPRGGYVAGPMIKAQDLGNLADVIADAMGWPYLCKGCGRAEDDCSADPCADVIADRAA